MLSQNIALKPCSDCGVIPEPFCKCTKPSKRTMLNKDGELHEESPDCRGECCTPAECRNPNHTLTDGSLSPHEIGPSCMADRS